jgi:hypothetical protein
VRAAARVALLCSVLAAGCAVRAPNLAGPAVELERTPFFPQSRYQCGPAATATVLSTAGIQVRPEALVPEIYLPGRRGSLQAEIVAAVRRHGAVPFVIEPGLEALLAEVRHGRPVLVLQNLGLPAVPVWHYAVVVGFDPAANRILLRSGRERRQQVSTRRFLQTWESAGRWGLVVLRPGELPADPDPMRYLKAVAAVESVGLADNARRAYSAALERWPAHPLAMLGLANSLHALGRDEEAVGCYRTLLAAEPDHAIARNNLAEALASLGCHDTALETIDEALASASMDDMLRAALAATRREIVERRGEENAFRCRLAR